MHLKGMVASTVFAVALAGCVSPNQVAMSIGAPPGSDEGVTTLQLRSMQARHFETHDVTKVLRASTDTLQDLGFTITESSADVGVLVASKERDAEEAGQVAGQIALAILGALVGAYTNPAWDTEQAIFVTLIASPVEGSDETQVRALFDRRLTNNHGQLWRTELINDPEIYQEFFGKLSQALFLEAQKV